MRNNVETINRLIDPPRPSILYHSPLTTSASNKVKGGAELVFLWLLLHSRCAGVEMKLVLCTHNLIEVLTFLWSTLPF